MGREVRVKEHCGYLDIHYLTRPESIMPRCEIAPGTVVNMIRERGEQAIIRDSTGTYLLPKKKLDI